MRFMGIKIGKSKEKPEKDGIKAGNTPAAPIAGTEEQTNRRRKKSEAKVKQVPVPLDTAADNPNEGEDTPPRPHGPIQELSVEPSDISTDIDTDFDDAKNIANPPEGNEPKVKMVEITPEAAPPVEEKKAEKPKDASDSFTSLFSNDDVEENPLINLINSLPDVTTQELLSDLNEIK